MLGGAGALGAGLSASASPLFKGHSLSSAALRSTAGRAGQLPRPTAPQLRRWTLTATDGFVSMPDPALLDQIAPYWPDVLAPNDPATDMANMYIFGFVEVTDIAGFASSANLPPAFDPTQLITAVDFKGKAQLTAPVLYCDEGDDVRLTLRNDGLATRPDLFDNHTVHWHGFPNQIPYFDGVPDASIGVPDGSELTYQFIPVDPGTYMYHCHVEDVEHVTMGLHGMVFVRPAKGKNYAYNDTDNSTQFDRQFVFLLTDANVENHWNDGHIQVSDWSQYRSTFSLMNGRAWPDTIEPNGPFYDRDTNAWRGSQLAGSAAVRLAHNPYSSLIQAKAGERVLLRLSNLGFDEKSLMLPGIELTVVGRDAKFLGTGRPDYFGAGARGAITYKTDRIDIGPGESRDVIFTAPAVTASATADAPDVYTLYDRSVLFLGKNTSPAAGAEAKDGLGALRTEIHIYPATSPLMQTQQHPSQLFPRSNGSFHS